MAVGVCLDHPEHRYLRPDRLAKAKQVPLHGAQIDLGDRGTYGGADIYFGKRDECPFRRSPRDSGLAGLTLQSFACVWRSVNFI